MSIISSSSSSDSILHPNISSTNLLPLYLYCLTATPGSFIFTSYIITYVFLLLPLCIFIIYHGLQQWRQKRSTSSAATMSHSDCFTYNMATIELIGVFGSILCCCGIYSDQLHIILVGFCLFCFAWFGQTFIHALTCVERYLAVVHPITYLSLRKERGIRIRNISIGCVWLICIAGGSLLTVKDVFIIVDFCFMISSLTVVSFCSLSVLFVLIRPGPGEQGEGRERVDQSKQRAFYTILAILGVLVVKFVWSLAWSVLSALEKVDNCVIMTSSTWSSLLSSLVLPLLFLNRAGKLVCWKNNIERQ